MGGTGSGGKRPNAGRASLPGSKYDRKKAKLLEMAAKGSGNVSHMLIPSKTTDPITPFDELSLNGENIQDRDNADNSECLSDAESIEEQPLSSLFPEYLNNYNATEDSDEDTDTELNEEEVDEVLDENTESELDDEDTRNITGVHALVLSNIRKNIQKETELSKSSSHSAVTPILDDLKKGQCWIKAPIGTSTMMRNEEKDPALLCIPDIFIFIPSITFPGITLRCIHGCTSGHVHENGWQEHLGRRVVALGNIYYVISKEYRCTSCEKRWAGYHENAVKLLPEYCQTFFPAVLTHRGAIDKNLFFFLRSLMLNGLGPTTLAKLLNELNCRNHSLHEIAFYDACVKMASHVSHFFGINSSTPVKKFSSFEDRTLYSGRFFTGKWITTIFVRHHERIRPYLDKVMSLRSSKMLAIDHSMKVVKRITYKGAKIFNSLFTAVNEYGEIRLQSFCLTKSLAEMNPQLVKMRETMERTSDSSLRYVYTDNCCNDRPELNSVFEYLQLDRVSQDPLSLKMYENPVDLIITTVESQHHLRTICDTLLQEIKGSYIGLDAEWNFGVGRSPGKLALLQIYPGNNTVFLCRMTKIKGLPKSLIEILRSAEIKKVGVRVNNDIKKLLHDFNHDKVYDGAVELGTFARKRGVVDDARISLAGLCRLLLKKDLDKSPRYSDWENAELSERQKNYAASDAIVSYEVFKRLLYIGFDRLKKITSNLIGQKVSILNSSGLQFDTVLAEAEILQIRSNQCKVKIIQIYKKGAVLGKTPELSLSEEIVGLETWVDCKVVSLKLISNEISSVSSTTSQILDDMKEHENSHLGTAQNVMLDVFHVLHRIKFKKNHLRKSFFEAFRNALFECDKEDLANVKTVLKSKGLSDLKIESMISKWGTYLQKRVRRIIPSSEVLVARLQQVYEIYSEKKDRKNRPLFSSTNKADYLKIIDHARRGCISDPKDFEIYSEKGKDKDGLKMYQCCRGTSIVESYHQKLIAQFSSFNAGPIFADALLSELRHRLSSVAAVNRRGVYDPGHFDQFLIEKIQILTARLFGESAYPLWPSTLEWGNSRESFGFMRVEESSERFGIATGNLPKSLIKLPQNTHLSKELSYLAKKMDVAIPPLQFHTKEEYYLYRQCRLEGLTDSEIVLKFAQCANGRTLFPKLLETVKNFAKTYDDFVNTSILLESEDFDIEFICNLESEDVISCSSEEDEEEEEEEEEEGGEEMAAVEEEEKMTTSEVLHECKQPDHFFPQDHHDHGSTLPEEAQSIQFEIGANTFSTGLQSAIANLVIPLQFNDMNQPIEQTRKIKRCQADHRSNEQRLAHKGLKFICGKTQCSGMRGHHLCKTPIEEYIKKLDLRSNQSLGQIQRKRVKKEKRCLAVDPQDSTIQCLSITCPGRGNRALCTKFNVE